MKSVLNFLTRLQVNNNREWFIEHKSEYEAAKSKFEALVEDVIARVLVFDQSIKGLKAKDCTYRIYRDVRFSADKSPYKTHMGAYICRGGKKSGYTGYYFHISVDEAYGLNHMVAVGDYMMDPKVLKILREDVVNCGEEFGEIMKNLDSRFAIPDEFKLKRVPRGFDPDDPHAEYLKLKSFCVSMSLSDEDVLSPVLAENISNAFQSAKPFLDFINRAIDYARYEE